MELYGIVEKDVGGVCALSLGRIEVAVGVAGAGDTVGAVGATGVDGGGGGGVETAPMAVKTSCRSASFQPWDFKLVLIVSFAVPTDNCCLTYLSNCSFII